MSGSLQKAAPENLCLKILGRLDWPRGFTVCAGLSAEPFAVNWVETKAVVEIRRSEGERDMLVYQSETREVLRRIVFKLRADAALHDDLTQEALVHLWLREKQRPGQTQSWYLQSCRLFLQNYMRNGRSVNSTRHRKNLGSSIKLDELAGENTEGESVSCGSVVALVSAREIVTLLTKWLTPLEVRILDCLAEGLGIREIASRLGVSHTSVVRYRRRIAALAVRLGVEPVPSGNGWPRQNRPRSAVR